MFTDSFDIVYGWYDNKNNKVPKGAKIISIKDVPKNRNVQCVEFEFDTAEHYKEFVESYYDESLDSVHEWGGCKYNSKDLGL